MNSAVTRTGFACFNAARVPDEVPCTGTVGCVPLPGVKAASSCGMISAALCQRSAARFSRHRMITDASAGGTLGRWTLTDSGVCVTCAISSAWALPPVNGGRPASISYATAPSAYRSARWSTCGSAEACSGAMYAGVPNATPSDVRPEALPDSLTALATPKSVTRAWPRLTITLSGLMSRCTTPCSCAYASASVTSRSNRTASATGSSPSRASFARSDSPSMNGITYHSRSPDAFALNSGTTCGCWSRAASWISRRNRSWLTLAAISGGRTLTTTLRASFTSSARKTRLMPPPPSSRSMRKSVPSASDSRCVKSFKRTCPRWTWLQVRGRYRTRPECAGGVFIPRFHAVPSLAVSDIGSRLEKALAGRYAVERELGHGGMATVHLARDVKHGRTVAIKVLRPDLAQAVGSERFLRDINIAAQLQSPHILPMLESGEADGLLYYVMPYVEGDSLRGRLVKQGSLPPSEAMRLLRDVVDALAHAHRHQVVHRDIKPDNVMIADRHALVMDFGVAKAMSEAKGTSGLTSIGVSLGTPAYMAPEQAAADPYIDHRADIYSAGVLAYEMLAGKPPFEGSPQSVLTAHIGTAPKPLAQLKPDVPPAIAQIVMKCLEKDPAKRYQTADELLQAIEALATPVPGTGPVAASRATRTRRWMIGGAAIVAAT